MARKWIHSASVEIDDATGALLVAPNSTPADLLGAVGAIEGASGAEFPLFTLTGNVQRLGMEPVVTGDVDNLTARYEQILGLNAGNTDNGKLYVSFIDDGSSHYHVELYKGSARNAGVLVAHTISVVAGAPVNQALITDSPGGVSSGVSGFIGMQGFIHAQLDIVAAFTLTRPCRHVNVRAPQVDIDGGVANAKAFSIGYSPTSAAAHVVNLANSEGIRVAVNDACALYVKGTAADRLKYSVKA
jgi:hypothetical protein